jgi:adenine deaminase
MDITINNALIPDFFNMKWKKGHIGIENGKIVKVSERKLTGKNTLDVEEKAVTPGLIDCHCHIESSYATPCCFGQLVARFGTLKVVADCHEIANVAGLSGVKYFIENAKLTDISIKFAASSCVPASNITKGGGELSRDDIKELLQMDEVVALGEVMDINGVLNKNEKIMSIISLAKELNKPINGHAAGLKGDRLLEYVKIGNVSDDHESEGIDEIEEKLKAGLKIFLREGSAATTEMKAYTLAEKYPDDMMYCTDDKTVSDILETGHINFHLKKAVEVGLDPILALKLATLNGYKYYNFLGGVIEKGVPADLVVFDDLKSFDPLFVITNGALYNAKYEQFYVPDNLLHSINIVKPIVIPKLRGAAQKFVISVKEGSLVTAKEQLLQLIPPHDKSIANTNKDNIPEVIIDKDILKITNIDRYGRHKKASGRIKGFKLEKGAIGSSLSHDCHNIIVVGTNDNNLEKVVNKILEIEGGLVCYDEKEFAILKLNIGGILSDDLPENLAENINKINRYAKELGCQFKEPFAMLSFMALEVIPHLKLTSDGLFDVDLNRFL